MKSQRITLFALAFAFSVFQGKAQKVLQDWNAYVASKNIAGTGYVDLVQGVLEKAGQTYHYSGPGRVLSVKLEGDNPGLIFPVPLRVSVFSVDNNGRPVAEIAGQNTSFQPWENSIQVDFSGGVTVNRPFALVVALRSTAYPGQTFRLKYTGDGDGKGRDLASLAGTTTGGNWSSAKNNFGRDGDFYLIPRMSHDITSGFSVNGNCLASGSSISFTNKSMLSRDSMFNLLFWSGYTGSAKLYTWQFGDGNTSNAENPSHTYSTPGSYTVKLITTLVGWTSSKNDTSMLKISVGLSVSATSKTNLTCNGISTGSITASATGGTSPYQYSLDGFNYQTPATFSGLAAGPYTLHVKDQLGCAATVSVTLTQPAAITFSSIQTSNASCNNADGAILASATGGTGTLQYRVDAGAWQSGGSFSGLSWGPHILSAMDANMCIVSAAVVIDNFSSPTLTVSYNNVSCNGGNDGSITLTSSGGTGSVQYSINGGLSYQSSGVFTGLPAGKYSALVKDVAGCGQGEVVTINQPNAISSLVSTKAATCFAKADGEIHISSAIGGIGKLAYSLNGLNYQSVPDFYALPGGNYTVYVKDAASCVVTKSVTVARPADITATYTLTHVNCYGSNNGTILVNANGGTPPYQYSLDRGAYQPTNQFANVGADTWTLMVKDANNCTQTGTAIITQPPVIVPVISSTNSTCGNANGSLLISASGGSGARYTYSLDGTTFQTSGLFSGKSSGTYAISVKDTAGCVVTTTGDIQDSNGPSFGSISSTNVTCNGGNDGSITVNSVSGGSGTIEYSLTGANWQTSNKFTGLSAGNYNIQVRDANKCISQSQTIIISQPAAISLSKTVTNVRCNGESDGSAVILASGGAGTLAYSINGGLSWQSSNVFNNLNAGEYMVMVRDAGGCMGTISFNIEEAPRITALLSILNVQCHGARSGEVNFTASGGKAPYQYSIGGAYQSSGRFTGLSGGNYIYFIKDANNCTTTGEFILFEPTALTVTAIAADVSCAGGNNGVINLSVGGGIAPYTYEWSNGANTEDIFNLRAGTYNVTVTDDYGCRETRNYTLSQPAQPIVVNGVVTDADGTLGSVDITVTGGVPPYRFFWSNNATTEDVTELLPGNYTVTVTDANLCVATSTFTVKVSAGVDKATLGKAVKLYPNPASEKVNLLVEGYKADKVYIINTSGRTVYETIPIGSAVSIDTRTFAAGIYTVIVRSGNTQTALHMVIEK
jgi:PKD repeat protein